MSDDSTTRIKTTRSLAHTGNWTPLRVALPEKVPTTSSMVPQNHEAQTRPDHRKVNSGRSQPPRTSEAPEISLGDGDFIMNPGTLQPPRPIAPPPVPLDRLAVLMEEDRSTVSSAWYKDFFDSDYLRSVPLTRPVDVAVECDFIERCLALNKGASILDVGCGMGVHAIELAVRGYQVSGIDLSSAMLQRAQRESKHQSVSVRWMQGDMRELAQDRGFDAILCWGTSFGYFDDAENQRCLDAMMRALKPEGVLLLHVINRDYFLKSQPNQVWFELADQLCMEESSFEYELSRLNVKRRIILPDGTENKRECSIRLYALHEIVTLLHAAKFEIEEVSGRIALRGIFFGSDSAEIIVLARKPATASRANTRSRPAPPPMPPAHEPTPTQKLRTSIPPKKS